MSEKTKWEGLWQSRQGVYSGATIKKKDIPTYARLVVRYNKFYEKDSNRPKFVYCFADSEAYKDMCVPIEIEEYESTSEQFAKLDELVEVMREGHANGYKMELPSQSLNRAKELYERAIELVEEITGEKWEFGYCTWG